MIDLVEQGGALRGKQIGLIVSGSIASYKALELLRELTKLGATVQVAMTSGAQKFVTPLPFQTLSGRPVYTDLWSLTQESEIGHIEFADRCDLLVVAPATGNVIAKLANGIADDAATTVALACKAPLLVAPAMNVNMLEHPATQENLEKLRGRGITIVEPGIGELACGWVGGGRLAEISQIVHHCENILTPKDLLGTAVLITAGPTRERFDPVRFFTNGSTGKMGYELARLAALRGAVVTLISGPSSERAPEGVDLITVESALEMYDSALSQAETLFHTRGRTLILKASAVTDFTPESGAEVSKVKVDKTSPLTLRFTPTQDILHALCERRAKLGAKTVIVGFAAESATGDELIRIARDKLTRKGADGIIANTISEAMGTETNQVWILHREGGVTHLPTASKREIASGILNTVVSWESL